MKFSRSHMAVDADCRFKSWLTFWKDGTGYVKARANIGQTIGQLGHKLIAKVVKAVLSGQGGDLHETVLREAEVARGGFEFFDDADEHDWIMQVNILEALLRVWLRFRLPQLLETYEILDIEREVNIPLDRHVLMSRPDMVVRRRSDGVILCGPEFKVLGWLDDKIVEEYRYDTQLLSHALDAQHVYEQEAQGVLLEILYKGKRSYGEGQRVYYSPLVRGWRNGEDFTWDYAQGRRKGWEVTGVPPFTVAEWLKLVPEDIQRSQIVTAELWRSGAELEQWVEQIEYRLDEIEAALPTLWAEEDAALLRKVFPARLDAGCYSNKYRRSCQFLKYCFGQVEALDEFSGFEVRKPHHPQEFEGE